MEKIIRRHSDLVQIKENARLLLDMLKQYAPRSSTSTEREIMRQLFDSCEQHRPRVFKLAAEIAESNIETEEGPNLGKQSATSAYPAVKSNWYKPFSGWYPTGCIATAIFES